MTEADLGSPAAPLAVSGEEYVDALDYPCAAADHRR
jgi:hypothetical protein